MGKTSLRVAISVIFFGLLFYMMRNELPHIVETLRGVRPGWALCGVAVYLTAVLMIAKRLEVIYEVQGTPIGFKRSAEISFIGFFFNNFLPTAVGGDLVKAYCGSKLTKERFKSFISVFVDRIFGLLMFVLIPSFTVLFLKDQLDGWVVQTVFGALAAGIFCVFLILHRGWLKPLAFLGPLLEKIRLKDKLAMAYDGLHHFKNHKKAVATVMATSISGQILGTLAVYFFIRALGANIDVWYVFLLTPVVLLMSMLPSINGLGVREGAFVYFFKNFIGVPEATALAVLYLAMLLIISMIGAVTYLMKHEYHFKLRDVTTKTPQILHGEKR